MLNRIPRVPARSLLCLLLGAVALLAQAQSTLPGAVQRALAEAKIPSAGVAVVVQEVGVHHEILRANATAPMNPASVMKLVTTFAALDQLGPAYRWKTEAYVSGTLADGVLDGDLALKGYGDPKLTLESFWLLLRNLRERGLRDIRGDLVLDRTYFEPREHDPGRFDGEPLRPYNVGADALLVNYKSVRFNFIPEVDANAVRVGLEPHMQPLEVINLLRLANGPCGDWREKIRADFNPLPSPQRGVRAIFAGTYPESCGERDWHVALLEPQAYLEGLFRELWEELGGRWGGSAREGSVPPQARLLYSHESETLAEAVRDMNKFSNNVMARQIYLTMAAESAGAPARRAAALQAVQGWLARRRMDFPELQIENGSGLSRTDRISAQHLAELLDVAFQSAVMPEFVASMPLVAVDGTMRKRLKGEPVAGHSHMKTGTLNDVRAMAGYVLAASGRRYVVVMLVNHPNSGEAQPAMDSLLSWVYGR